jgi:hypothetical protein
VLGKREEGRGKRGNLGAIRKFKIWIIAAGVLALLSGAGRALAGEFPKIHGFLEEAYAPRFGSSDARHRQYAMAEGRAQLKTDYYFDGDNFLADWGTVLRAKCDFVLDLYQGGKCLTDLRELNAALTPLDILDIKIGRQVLTWGTGDYIFLNDLFPKDYVSFLIGRDDEYLKKPNDALRAMLYSDIINFDFAVMPFFEPNTVPDGYRLTFFDTFTGGINGVEAERDYVEPSKKAKNFVYAARAYRNFSSYETALYYYRGFDPSPKSYKNEAAHQLYYERLDAYGASVRGPLLWGIANAEFSYYYSPEDTEGDIRTIQNSMVKYLIGYEKDMGNDFRMGFQYYVEQTADYKEYKNALLQADYSWPQFRHLITNRLTKMFANQTVKISIFSFFSPSDLDAYIRPTMEWKATDAWTLTIGANLPWGKDAWTEFGSLQKNKNVFARLRYSF